MNKEKELLLALLIEKYTQIKPVERTRIKQRSKRMQRTKMHKWTKQEKEQLMLMRSQGDSFRHIADMFGLRASQVENMHYSIQNRNGGA